MQPLGTVVSAVLLSCATAYGVVAVSTDPAAPPLPPAGAGAVGDADISSGTTLTAMAEEIEQLRARLAELEQRAPRTAVGAAVSDQQVATAVDAWMERHGPLAATNATPPTAEVEADYERLWKALSVDGDDWKKREELWAEARKAGLMDRLVEAFEARAEQYPSDPDAHSQLGSAYLQQVQSASDVGEQGRLAMSADASFTKALELDPNHWRARFSKAVSLSFWPPVMGRGSEAITHFETLIEQQNASGVAADHHAMPYVFLGNMLEQQGKSDRAREIWQNGYALYPGNDDLRKRIEALGGSR